MTSKKSSAKRPLTDDEEVEIQRMIASDPDNPELTDDEIARLRPFAEALPALAEGIRRRPEPETRVQCRCGATEIEIKAEPIVQFYCHCDDCQAVHGAAYVPESVYPADAVHVIRGDPLTWKLKRNPRVTCRECGTRLFIDVLARSLRGVNGRLLPEGEFRPAFHMHCRFAVRPVIDDLPHYKGLPKRFGSSDETVAW